MAAEEIGGGREHPGIVAGHRKAHRVEQPVVQGVQLRAHPALAADHNLVVKMVQVQGQGPASHNVQVFKGHHDLVGQLDPAQPRQGAGDRLKNSQPGQVGLDLTLRHFGAVEGIDVHG